MANDAEYSGRICDGKYDVRRVLVRRVRLSRKAPCHFADDHTVIFELLIREDWPLITRDCSPIFFNPIIYVVVRRTVEDFIAQPDLIYTCTITFLRYRQKPCVYLPETFCAFHESNVWSILFKPKNLDLSKYVISARRTNILY